MIGHDVLDSTSTMFHGHHSTSESELEGREEDAGANHDCEAHPRFLRKLTLPGYSVFLHSCTFSVSQHNIMFTVTYIRCAESLSAV